MDKQGIHTPTASTLNRAEQISEVGEEILERLTKEKSSDYVELKLYMLSFLKYKQPKTKEEWDALFARRDAGDQSARDELVYRNMRLVLRIASYYGSHRPYLLDLAQEGTFGLLEAIDQFNPSLGFAFSTFAVWWIRQAITKALHTVAPIYGLYVSFNTRDRMLFVIRHVRLFETKHGKVPNVLELYQQIKSEAENGSKIAQMITVKDLMGTLSLIRTRGLVSLDLPIFDEEDSVTFGDQLVTSRVRPETYLQAHELLTRYESALLRIRQYVERLPVRTAEIFRLTFGLDGSIKLNLEELAIRYNISRERVRQILEEGMTILRSSGITLTAQDIDLLVDRKNELLEAVETAHL